MAYSCTQRSKYYSRNLVYDDLDLARRSRKLSPMFVYSGTYETWNSAMKYCGLWPDYCSPTWTFEILWAVAGLLFPDLNFKRLLSPVVFGYSLVQKCLNLLCRSVFLNQSFSGTFRTGRLRETVSLTHLMARCSGCFGGTSGDHSWTVIIKEYLMTNKTSCFLSDAQREGDVRRQQRVERRRWQIIDILLKSLLMSPEFKLRGVFVPLCLILTLKVELLLGVL